MNLVRDQWNRPVQSKAVKALLGLGSKPLPDEGMPCRLIQGVHVWVAPREGPRRFYLRVMCSCPECEKVMALGRLAQHAKTHFVDLAE